MRVGFGGYRISVKSGEHRRALEKALDFGCSLIDTSTNYTDGESERLIGEVLKGRSNRPLVISKAGYIQGQNIQRFKDLLAKNPSLEFVDFGEDLKHSIDPVFLKDQLDRSLERLGIEALDSLLLHNPEYFLKKNPGQKDEYYSRITRAFEYLQSEVKRGRIKSFGVSSNTFISPREDEDATDLDKVWEAAQKANAAEGFKYIQFPLNLVEMGALERQYAGENLIERAKELGLTTMANRPLNAFTSSGLLRLATYKVESLPSDVDAYFMEKTKPLFDEWNEHRESEDDKLDELPLFEQIRKIWSQQASADAVQQIFFGHFFPFIARLFARDLSAAESQPFYDLYETSLEFAKKNMSERAHSFAQQARQSGLLSADGEGSLSQEVLNRYAQTGIDVVLVGMRQPEYVEDLKNFF